MLLLLFQSQSQKEVQTNNWNRNVLIDVHCTDDFIVGMHTAFEHKYKATGLLWLYLSNLAEPILN